MKRFIVLLALIGFGVFGWYRMSLLPVERGSEQRVKVKILEGVSLQEIAGVLHEKGIIRSPQAFSVYVRMRGDSAKLQAGTFILQPASSVSELVSMLLSGKAEETSITIPEGFTVLEIDALMAKNGFIEEGEIISCAQTCDFSVFEFLPAEDDLAERGGQIEGYLFPDTYFVAAQDFHPKFFLERLMTTFRHRVYEEYAQEIQLSGRSLHELITMASLVEEETRSDEERGVVAGILWKRFDDGRGLGVDATVRYILYKPTEDITVADLNTNSSYNTRKFKGLPPGPIATVSEKSFRAVLEPIETEYWYYLHSPDGQIHYAVSNEDHNVNRNTYLR